MTLVSRDEVIPTEAPAMVNGQGDAMDVDMHHINRIKKKKKAGPFGFFRAALVALRSTDSKKKKTASTFIKDDEKIAAIDHVNSNTDNIDGNWKMIVGSMRPLHLQQEVLSPPPSLPPVRLDADHQYHHHHSFSFPSSPSFSSSSGTMSQYASASNLQALDDSGERDEDNDPDVVFDALRGDELIDSKAEEFIAQFYHQMRIDKHQILHQRTKTTLF